MIFSPLENRTLPWLAVNRCSIGSVDSRTVWANLDFLKTSGKTGFGLCSLTVITVASNKQHNVRYQTADRLSGETVAQRRWEVKQNLIIKHVDKGDISTVKSLFLVLRW